MKTHRKTVYSRPNIIPGDLAPVTRRSVAKAAGVSLTTVTHALNPVPGVRVSRETRERVMRIAQELGYRPNFVGRALTSGKTFAAGLLQPSPSSMFFSLYRDIMMGMMQAMEADDYHLLMLFRSANERYLKPIHQGKVDGVFVLQSDANLAHIEQVTATGIPTVVVNKGYAVSPDKPVGCVHADHAGMVRDVLGELAGCGCRTVLFIHDYLCSDANAQILQAFTVEMERRAASGLTGATFTPSDGNFAMQVRSVFASGQRWEGIFIDGIERAEIFLAEAQAAGKRAGRDFQLITSDIGDGRTTCSRAERSAYTQQPELVGRQAWQVLRGLIRQEKIERVLKVPYRRVPVCE